MRRDRRSELISVAPLLALVALAGACQKARTLETLALQQLAPPPQTVTLQITGYRAPTGRMLKNLFVSNFSVKAERGQLSLVSSRDGMPDALKQAHAADYGFAPGSPNSANPSFGDLLLWLAGIGSAQQGLLYCADATAGNTSRDGLSYSDSRNSPATRVFLGLRDCEKSYLGLDPKSFDFDGDGIPDYLEMRCGLNPQNRNDATLSISGDGVTNLEKCKRNIPVDESADSQPNQLFAYKYSQALQKDGTTVFTISNIPVLNGGQDNFIAFYLTDADATTNQPSLYTAFTQLKAGAAGKTLTFPFWGTDPAKRYDQEVIF